MARINMLNPGVTDTASVQAILDCAQARCRVRTLAPNDVAAHARAADQLLESLGIPRRSAVGSAYYLGPPAHGLKYNRSDRGAGQSGLATTLLLSLERGGWRIWSVSRERCGRSPGGGPRRYHLVLSVAARKFLRSKRPPAAPTETLRSALRIGKLEGDSSFATPPC